MAERLRSRLTARAEVIGSEHFRLGGMQVGSIYDVVCYTPCGEERWHERVHNIVVDQGLRSMLSV